MTVARFTSNIQLLYFCCRQYAWQQWRYEVPCHNCFEFENHRLARHGATHASEICSGENQEYPPYRILGPQGTSRGVTTLLEEGQQSGLDTLANDSNLFGIRAESRPHQHLRLAIVTHNSSYV